MATTWYTKPISQLLMLLSLTLCASANMKCDMNLLRQCNENDNSYCCKRLRDSYFMMETGFLTGKALLVSDHMISNAINFRSYICNNMLEADNQFVIMQ